MRQWTATPLILTLSLTACGAPMPESIGVTPEGTLAPCPETPNCVHTGLGHPPGTQPLVLREDVELPDVMAELERIVASLPRTTVVRTNDRYLHAEARSRVFRFVDDLELLVTDDRELVVRSASRLGRSDLGVNGRRVERLRGEVAESGLLR